MNNTPPKLRNGKSLYQQARAAIVLRGETIESFCHGLGLSRNTLSMALRSDLCPHARKKIIKAINLAA